MKYIGDEKKLVKFLKENKMTIKRNKGNIDISAVNNSGTIINWFKNKGTISFQGTENNELKDKLSNFINEGSETKFTKNDVNKRIFIVHGHDEKARLDLETILFEWKLEPVVSTKQPNSGKTIIEKLIRDFESCNYGIVLMTPDDEGYAKNEGKEKTRSRARQNVIFELGILIGKLGREKVLLLKKKGDFEKPSDISGLLCKEYQERVSETREEIRKELKASGIEIND